MAGKKAPRKKAAKKKTAKKKTATRRTDRNASTRARMDAKTKRDEKRYSVFLETLANGGTVADACEASTLSRSTVYERRDNDEEFDRAWLDAYETGTDSLESVAIRRGRTGSDRLLEFVLKSRHARFRGETSGNGRTTRRRVEFVVVDASDPDRKDTGEE